MPEAGFHFASPWWLLALPAPLLVWLWLRLTQPRRDIERYRGYADAHLLPHLLGMRDAAPHGIRRRLLAWTALWLLLVLALAGPRWDYTDMQLFRPGSDLVILLDLSRSMDVADVAPSRLARARQEIEDLLKHNRHSRVGLIAFASIAHIMSPLTEDGATLLRQLPAISTDLVQLKGSRVTEALVRARQMLGGQPADSSRHLLLITDGDFADPDYLEMATELAAADIRVHVLGIGTLEGAAVPGPGNAPLRHPRHGTVISRLDEQNLQALAERGGGLYRRADYDDADTDALLARIAADSRAEAVAEAKTRVWNERFFWLVALVMLLLLPRFRRVAARRSP
jgi:Ca-activated chloride channel family protein